MLFPSSARFAKPWAYWPSVSASYWNQPRLTLEPALQANLHIGIENVQDEAVWTHDLGEECNRARQYA